MRLILLLLVSCSAGPAFTAEDTTSATHAVQLGKACEELCQSEAGCTPSQASTCFEAMDCNIGSMLFRHGAPDLLDGGAACKP